MAKLAGWQWVYDNFVAKSYVDAALAGKQDLLDTGWRSLPLENGWTGTLKFRWVNGWMQVQVLDLNGAAATSSNLYVNLGSDTAFYAGPGTPAFGVGNLGSSGAAPSASEIGSISMSGGTNNSILRASSPTSDWSGGSASLTFPAMSDALPNPLPGTPA